MEARTEFRGCERTAGLWRTSASANPPLKSEVADVYHDGESEAEAVWVSDRVCHTVCLGSAEVWSDLIKFESPLIRADVTEPSPRRFRSLLRFGYDCFHNGHIVYLYFPYFPSSRIYIL